MGVKRILTQAVLDGHMDHVIKDALIIKLHLVLGRVYIHIHFGRIHLKVEDDEGVGTLRDQVGICRPDPMHEVGTLDVSAH